VFIEEVIESIVELVKRQLSLNIYPLCDHAGTVTCFITLVTSFIMVVSPVSPGHL
jgi:hypothetical protein